MGVTSTNRSCGGFAAERQGVGHTKPRGRNWIPGERGNRGTAQIESAIGAGGVRGPAGRSRDGGNTTSDRPAIGCENGEEITAQVDHDSPSDAEDAGMGAGSKSQEVDGERLGLGNEDRRPVEFRFARDAVGSRESARVWKRGCDVQPAVAADEPAAEEWE